mgnify:CR=1 FL=1
MLARVPIISAYDSRRESMLAYASPSYEIAMTIVGLVNNCLGTISQLLPPLFHTRNIYFLASLFKQPLAFIYVLFIILQIYPITPTKYLLVLGKANVKRA